MLIAYKFQPEKLFAAVHGFIRMTFPGSSLVEDNVAINADINIFIEMKHENEALSLNGFIKTDATPISLAKEYNLSGCLKVDKEINRNIRRFTFELLSQYQGKPISAYGILNGVRPVKLAHHFLDEHKSQSELNNILVKDFYLQAEKAALLSEVAFNNRPFLLSKEKAKKLISIYIGIPFCPTRCYYCSFPGAVLKNHEGDIVPFLDSLITEIKALSFHLQALAIKVQSIYIGGGTPTILSNEDMAQLLEAINYYLKSEATVEFTIEAGRPDTLSLTKLKLLKEYGVTRVCINPQTMNDKTLAIIGRKHNEYQIIKAVEDARQLGIKHINMDVIVGLPGESAAEYVYTAKKILSLQPENITIHTLAMKKGSPMAENEGGNIQMGIKNVEDGVDYFINFLRDQGYVPYYLYRQKYMRGDMENIGFSLPNDFCIYNIQMIEEKQTIIGLGGGATSKFYNPRDGSLAAIYNPKEPQAYLNSMERLVKRKVDKLKGLN